MQINEWHSSLKRGDDVYWTDPDDNISSGSYKVSSIASESGEIEEPDTPVTICNSAGSLAVVMAAELSPLGDLASVLAQAESFVEGFEDDDMQEGIPELLERIRAAKLVAKPSTRVVITDDNLVAFAKQAIAALQSQALLSDLDRQNLIETGSNLLSEIDRVNADQEAIDVIHDGMSAVLAVELNWAGSQLSHAVNDLSSWMEEAKAFGYTGAAAAVLDSGIAAAQAVLDRWETGDLAGAVRELIDWRDGAKAGLLATGVKLKELPTAVIELSGGVCNGVSTLGNVRVIVLDYDNGEDDPEANPVIPGRSDSHASVWVAAETESDPDFVRAVVDVAHAEA